MLMMMVTRTQSHLQPWRLDICNDSFKGSMQLLMWQPDIVGVALVMDWFDLRKEDFGQRLMLMMMVTQTQTHLHRPWRLDRCNHSFVHSM